MKKVLVLLLVSVFMLNSSLRELFKVPVIFAHYTEHRQSDQNLSLLDFLSMHYLGTDFNDDDQDRDNALPFKNVAEPISFQAVYTDLTEPVFDKSPTFHMEGLNLSDYRTFNLLNSLSGSVFRPPILS